jgi:hypothetical protein
VVLRFHTHAISLKQVRTPLAPARRSAAEGVSSCAVQHNTHTRGQHLLDQAAHSRLLTFGLGDKAVEAAKVDMRELRARAQVRHDGLVTAHRQHVLAVDLPVQVHVPWVLRARARPRAVVRTVHLPRLRQPLRASHAVYHQP